MSRWSWGSSAETAGGEGAEDRECRLSRLPKGESAEER